MANFLYQGLDGLGETDDANTGALDSILRTVDSLGSAFILSSNQPAPVFVQQPALYGAGNQTVYGGASVYGPGAPSGNSPLLLLLLLGVGGFFVFRSVKRG